LKNIFFADAHKTLQSQIKRESMKIRKISSLISFGMRKVFFQFSSPSIKLISGNFLVFLPVGYTITVGRFEFKALLIVVVVAFVGIEIVDAAVVVGVSSNLSVVIINLVTYTLTRTHTFLLYFLIHFLFSFSFSFSLSFIFLLNDVNFRRTCFE
jgi:hypothetical protein